jgi:hypothetical protein
MIDGYYAARGIDPEGRVRPHDLDDLRLDTLVR